MVRIVAREGKLVLDMDGRAQGRGAYVHREDACIDRFAASRMKEIRSLRTAIDRSERTRIAQAIRALLDSSASLA
jgi:predicted RNA-binding protein YlxR (DUF448 family)